MSRERVNAPSSEGGRQRAGRPEDPTVVRVRARAAAATAEIDLTDEELRALADAGVDPEEVQIIARTPHDADEVSEHDRDTARDDIEGLQQDEEY